MGSTDFLKVKAIALSRSSLEIFYTAADPPQVSLQHYTPMLHHPPRHGYATPSLANPFMVSRIYAQVTSCGHHCLLYWLGIECRTWGTANVPRRVKGEDNGVRSIRLWCVLKTQVLAETLLRIVCDSCFECRLSRQYLLIPWAMPV
jgi:hypothetical protein